MEILEVVDKEYLKRATAQAGCYITSRIVKNLMGVYFPSLTHISDDSVFVKDYIKSEIYIELKSDIMTFLIQNIHLKSHKIERMYKKTMTRKLESIFEHELAHYRIQNF